MTCDLFGHGVERSATFWGSNQRVALRRSWGPGPSACLIGCNPSTADAERDDATVRWWIAWGQALGFGRFVAVNLYPFVTSSPAECRRIAEWQNNGPDWYARDAMHSNLDVVAREAKSADIVIACWGAIAWDEMWIAYVIEAIQEGQEPWPDIHCFGVTKSGAPMHPLARGRHRLARDVEPKLWRLHDR